MTFGFLFVGILRIYFTHKNLTSIAHDCLVFVENILHVELTIALMGFNILTNFSKVKTVNSLDEIIIT
jgi:hypothetical protein